MDNKDKWAAVAFQMMLLTSGMGLLGSGLVMSFMDKGADLVAMAYTAGLMCFVFAYLPLFQKFKGMGVEAEMKPCDDEDGEKAS